MMAKPKRALLGVPRAASDTETLIGANIGILATMMFFVSTIAGFITVGGNGISFEPFGEVISGVFFTFLIFFPLLSLELLLLLWVLKLLSRRLPRIGTRVAAVVGAISMGMPFFLLEMGEWRFAFGLAILLAVFGLVMVVPSHREGQKSWAGPQLGSR